MLLPLCVFYLSNAGIIAARLTLQVVVEDPHIPILKTDPHVAETTGNLGSPLLYDHPGPPTHIPAMEDLITDLEIQGIMLFHGKILHCLRDYFNPASSR